MAKEQTAVTPAIRVFREQGVSFILKPYKYVERGGTEIASQELDVDEHGVIKTLIMEDERKNPLIILMHGDREVSTKELARILEVKMIQPCDPATANRHTGYLVGGTSPFGTRKLLPVYIEQTILDIPRIIINAGKKGLLAEIATADLVRVLKPIPVHVAR
ncbi:MAG: aminoacyl-tRNA deacylase [Syntrophaceae bacterium]|nr:aminoacyl-tRNA deacylase [Syntrophaceae bacterium]